MPLPQATTEEVIQKAKECPLIAARRIKVNGAVDIELFTPAAGNPVMRLPNPLNAPVEGILVTKQAAAGLVRLYLPGDAAYDNLSPPVDATKEIVVQATVINFTVRILAF